MCGCLRGWWWLNYSLDKLCRIISSYNIPSNVLLTMIKTTKDDLILHTQQFQPSYHRHTLLHPEVKMFRTFRCIKDSLGKSRMHDITLVHDLAVSLRVLFECLIRSVKKLQNLRPLTTSNIHISLGHFISKTMLRA